MGIETVIAAAAGAASIAGGIQERKQQKRAAEEQRRSQAVQGAIGEAQAARERKQTIRQARIQRAQVLAQGESAGVAGSSGVAGGLAGIQSQLTSNLNFQSSQLGLQGQITRSNQASADAQSKAANIGAATGIAQNVFQDAGGFKSVFKGFV